LFHIPFTLQRELLNPWALLDIHSADGGNILLALLQIRDFRIWCALCGSNYIPWTSTIQTPIIYKRSLFSVYIFKGHCQHPFFFSGKCICIPKRILRF